MYIILFKKKCIYYIYISADPGRRNGEGAREEEFQHHHQHHHHQPPPPQQQQHAAVLRYVFGSFRTLGTLCSRFCGISEMFRGGGRCFCCRCALLHDFFSTDFRQDVRDFVAEVLWHLRSSLPCCLGVAEARFC